MTFKARSILSTSPCRTSYFHVSTAYAILRSIGVEIGKRDFIGGLQ